MMTIYETGNHLPEGQLTNAEEALQLQLEANKRKQQTMDEAIAQKTEALIKVNTEIETLKKSYTTGNS
jgi:hypothetical protein